MKLFWENMFRNNDAVKNVFKFLFWFNDGDFILCYQRNPNEEAKLIVHINLGKPRREIKLSL